MATLMRVKLKWSNFSGGPGYSVFHMRDFGGADPASTASVNSALGKVGTFANSVKSIVANGVILTVENDVEIIDEANGQLVDVVTGTVIPPYTSNATVSNYSAASGAVITWRTQGIRRGRRLRGRTFLVPLAGGAYETNGSLAPTTITSLGTAAAALIDMAGDGDLGVYGRPSAPGATDGQWSAVTSFSVPDMAAVLRSRR